MTLKPGQYVRTDKGRIGKVLTEEYEYKDSYSQRIEFKDDVEETWYMDWEDIVDVADTPFDLVQIGDYVNGHKITAIYNTPRRHLESKVEFNMHWVMLYFYEETVEDIVTKEQFEERKYRWVEE